MVRARRVRAVVACTQNDECCSPNPKRKDQGKLVHNVNQTITQFFTAVKTEILPEVMNDLDNVENEKFKELPDVVLDVDVDDFKETLPSTPHRIELRDDKRDDLVVKDFNDAKFRNLHTDPKSLFKALICDDVDIDCIDETNTTSVQTKLEQIIKDERKYNVNDEILEVGDNKELALGRGLNQDQENKLKQNKDVSKLSIGQNHNNNNTGTKARRRLNTNQSSNQQSQPLKTKTVAKNNVENKVNNHKLTDFFPVRRSERKTKKTVLEEKQKTLEDNLRRNIEKGLRVYNFEGKGRGIVAMRLFNRGDFVVEYAGDLIDMQESRRRELKYAQDQNTGCYMYYFKHRNTQYCIDATAETGRLGRLVNHSRNGNLITRVIDVDQIPRLVLVAKDTIEIGEEVTYDYGDRSKESLKHHPWLAY